MAGSSRCPLFSSAARYSVSLIASSSPAMRAVINVIGCLFMDARSTVIRQRRLCSFNVAQTVSPRCSCNSCCRRCRCESLDRVGLFPCGYRSETTQAATNVCCSRRRGPITFSSPLPHAALTHPFQLCLGSVDLCSARVRSSPETHTFFGIIF